jgi:hypothetical protein
MNLRQEPLTCFWCARRHAAIPVWSGSMALALIAKPAVLLAEREHVVAARRLRRVLVERAWISHYQWLR